MSLKIGGVDPTKIMVGDTPAKKVIIAGQTAWQAIRKVTITAPTSSVFSQGSEIGDIDLISAWTGTGSSTRVAFSVDVTCDKRTRDNVITFFSAGDTIPAGTQLRPTATDGAGLYVFTEVAP